MTGRDAETGLEQTAMDQGDAPIGSREEDRLGRRPFAEALAAEIVAAPAARGYVMGLTGPWGSGKTSVLNMAVGALENDAIVVQFNPWMFSGTEALVSSFFDEIGKQLDKRDSKLKGIAEKLATYGHLLSPFAALVGAGTTVNSAADVFQTMAAAPSVFKQRQELQALLASLDRRLVVVVDDVDRLRPQEVLDIVRLVRLVGDFPNTLYLLAFDRPRVEECLGEGDPKRGRAYLEKIVQVTHDVPIAREPDVAAMFLASLEQLVGTVPTGPLDVSDWHNIFTLVVRPLLATPRSVRRLLGSLSMTMRLVGDEVALADLIGIEAVRVLQPAMFEAICSVAPYLGAERLVPDHSRYQHGRNAADTPIGPLFVVDARLAEEICRWLFPAARRYFENTYYGSEWEARWRGQRKVASAPVFRFYLERQLPDGVVPARTVDLALSVLTDRDALSALLAGLSGAELMDLLERLNTTLEDLAVCEALEQDPAHVALPVLLDLLPRLPEDTGMMSFSGSMVLMRAALRLLRRIPDDERADVIRAVLRETRSFSSRLILLRVAGHRKDIGTGLVAPDVAEELENQLRDQLIEVGPEGFAFESRSPRLAGLMAETAEGSAVLRRLAEDDRVMMSLFVGAVGQTRAHPLDGAAVEVTAVLAWEQLAGFLDEEMLIRRTAELLVAVDEGGLQLTDEEQAALGLAVEYATGNRPESSFERMMRLQWAPDPEQPVNAVTTDAPLDGPIAAEKDPD